MFDKIQDKIYVYRLSSTKISLILVEFNSFKSKVFEKPGETRLAIRFNAGPELLIDGQTPAQLKQVVAEGYLDDAERLIINIVVFLMQFSQNLHINSVPNSTFQAQQWSISGFAAQQWSFFKIYIPHYPWQCFKLNNVEGRRVQIDESLCIYTLLRIVI